MSKILLEAPVFNLQGALEAAKFGIDRLELCANFPEGEKHQARVCFAT